MANPRNEERRTQAGIIPACYFVMAIINNNHLITALEDALSVKMAAVNRYLSRANRFNISIRENELLEKQQSVVFVFRITNNYSYLEWCCPLTEDQHQKLGSSGYVPLIRSDKYLRVGVETFLGVHYAYASIRFPLERGGAMDFITALDYLHRELERYLCVLEAKPGCEGLIEALSPIE